MPHARTPFFHGWFIVAAAMAFSAFMVGTSIFSIGVFATPMEGELGWSRSVLFGALSVRLVAGALIAPVLGAWSDRRGGARAVMVAATLLMGASLSPLKWTDTVLEYYLVYGVTGAVSSAAAGAVLLGVVPKWFVRRRAAAIAFASAGGALGPLIFPVVTAELVGAAGWRDAWFFLGLISVAVLLPLSLLIHSSPEDIGLRPDGDTGGRDAPGGGERRVPAHAFTRSEALRTRSFWLTTAAFSIGLFAVNGWQPSWVAYLQSEGYSLRVAANSILVFGIFSFLGRFAWGIVVARVALHTAVLAELSLASIAVVVLLWVSGTPALFVWSVVYGISWGGFWLLQPLMLANYFGTRHLGAIRGVNQPFMAIGGGLGPVAAGAIFDLTGHYTWVLGLAVAGGLLAAFIGFAARPPRPRLDPPPRAEDAAEQA